MFIRSLVFPVFIVLIFGNICEAADIIDDFTASSPTKSLLRKIVIERVFDQDILQNADKFVGLVANQQWSCSTVRIYVANVLLEKADLTTKQALDLCTVLYRECVPYESFAIPRLLVQLLLCLPEGGEADMIYKAVTNAGWNNPGSDKPIPFEYFSRYKNDIDKNRRKYSGRGSPAIDFEFPFREIFLTKHHKLSINIKGGE
jgi:hypothetical protein